VKYELVLILTDIIPDSVKSGKKVDILLIMGTLIEWLNCKNISDNGYFDLE
jgi:hypothetical protein